MSQALPVVTILISTKDRSDDLRRTLRELRRQNYSTLEMLIIDDGSRTDLCRIVDEEWPEAAVVRHENSVGQSQRRSEAFLIAHGEYILQLDDDSHPVECDAIERAVAFMEENPRCAALAFQVFNGAVLPRYVSRRRAQFVASFVGCGVLFRQGAIRETQGYRSFFCSEREEEELGIQLLKQGWAIRFMPDVTVHHRVSPVNRRTGLGWMRGVRNKIWSMAMHYPLRRCVLEGSWTLAVACWDAIRLWRPHHLMRGIFECLLGLPRALRLRDPMSSEALRLYDALCFRGVFSEGEFQNPPPVGLHDLVRYWKAWRNRPRQRSLWDRRYGDIGSAVTVCFAHEMTASEPRQRQ